MSEPALESGYIRAQVEGKLLRITIARPEKRNSLTRAMYEDLIRSAEYAGENDDVHALLIDSEGDMFCAGNDIGDFANMSEEDFADETGGPALVFIRALAALDIPIVIAVQGQATGIGVTMLLHADLVVAGESAKFYTAFIDIGIVPEAGSSLLLPLFIGKQNTARLLLAGDTLNAEEAERAGLIAYRVPDEAVAERAEELVRRLADKPPQAMRYTKQLMRQGAGSDDLSGQIDRESKGVADRLQSAEAQAIFQKFLNRKR